MTRKEISKMYDVENGVIRSPGKFEGNMDYTVHFWDFYLNGCDTPCYNENDVYLSQFTIEKDDTIEFPELQDHIGQFIYLWEDGNGFVYSEISTEDLS